MNFKTNDGFEHHILTETSEGVTLAGRVLTNPSDTPLETEVEAIAHLQNIPDGISVKLTEGVEGDMNNHGAISQEEAQTKLEGTKPGTFLLRKEYDGIVPDQMVLSLRTGSKFLHVIMTKENIINTMVNKIKLHLKGTPVTLSQTYNDFNNILVNDLKQTCKSRGITLTEGVPAAASAV